MLNDSNFITALLLTLVAGAATGVGGVIILFTKKFSSKLLSASLGFSAGVMLFISLTELFPEASSTLGELYGEQKGMLFTILSFFSGIALIAIIDNLIPERENPHEYSSVQQDNESSKLMRLGIFSIIVIAIHNFPEGMATFITAMEDPQVGYSIAMAVAIHNIPEGIMVAIPIYYATHKKGKAIGNAFLSGIAEPIGGILGYFLLSRFFENSMSGIMLGIVAGIMTYISLDELLPTAEKYGEHHTAIIGVIAGMAVMAISILLI
ncbi:MAG: zinc transporter ZupT [Bacteroidales bacterium]|jgi:ZIP family zinc transporter|nr:zinc transporter ZupT [Bacteroidales bacterium]MBQ1280251.1 zinc transporter ZupT [Bacteroidales bacterium]